MGSVEKIDALMLRQCFLAAAENLNANREIINELNVFPVPDGDTGTNMTMTVMSAVKELEALPENAGMPAVCKAIAMGSLKGARGNSGVILSQLLRGFTKVAESEDALNAPIIAQAFSKAVETAYKAVMKPKEGTILTVARGMSEKAAELSLKELPFIDFVKQVLEQGEESLKETPELLPVLKEAGVVDSGGRGLLEVIRGGLNVLEGKRVSPDSLKNVMDSAPLRVNRGAIENAEIRYGYCTEFIIMLNRIFNAKNEADFKAFLNGVGDSVVCVAMDGMVKVHVHTNHPGKVFEEGLKYGSLTGMKVDNLREEHNERLFRMGRDGSYTEIRESVAPAAAPKGRTAIKKKYGFITVSVGKGLSEIFEELGVDRVIEGGQTMNPSTQDILNAIGEVNAETIFLLPNNKNIILAASQAADLSQDKKVIVIPSRSVPQGITALIHFIPDKSEEENEQEMKEALDTVKTGEVTYAIRDTEIDGHMIHTGDMMGIGDHGILSTGEDLGKVLKDMLHAMVDDESEVITLYYGEEVKSQDAERFADSVRTAFPDLEVDIHSGGQPIYYYIVSVE